MVNETLTILDPAGMHARPAGELVKLVKSFEGCRITLGNGTRNVAANSILGILSLGLKCGSQVSVTVEGDNERQAMEQIKQFISGMA